MSLFDRLARTIGSRTQSGLPDENNMAAQAAPQREAVQVLRPEPAPKSDPAPSCSGNRTRVEFIVGLMDPETLRYSVSGEEAMRQVFNILGECTMVPCRTAMQSPSGRMYMVESLRIVKYLESMPQGWDRDMAGLLKERFHQKKVISDVSSDHDIHFNAD